MIEPEMAFTDLQEMLVLTEEFLKYVIGVCLERHEEELEFLQKMYEPDLLETLKHIHQTQFETLTYTEAVDILLKSGESFEFPVKWGVDLQSEHERYLDRKTPKKTKTQFWGFSFFPSSSTSISAFKMTLFLHRPIECDFPEK